MNKLCPVWTVGVHLVSVCFSLDLSSESFVSSGRQLAVSDVFTF